MGRTSANSRFQGIAFNFWIDWICPREKKHFRSLGTTPISGKTLSEWKGHSRSSRRVPGYSRSSSRNWKFHSRNTKFHSRNGLSRLDQYETHNSRSNSRSDSRNCREPTRKIFICPCILGAFFQELGWPPRTRAFNTCERCDMWAWLQRFGGNYITNVTLKHWREQV